MSFHRVGRIVAAQIPHRDLQDCLLPTSLVAPHGAAGTLDHRDCWAVDALTLVCVGFS